MTQQLSIQVKNLILRLVKSPEEKGEILLGRKIVFTAQYDPDECNKVLEALCIRKESVLRYLEHKYQPTWREDGARFLKQKCIQLAMIKEDGTLFIHIKNSEPHKILTDTIHVMNLLREQDFDFDDTKLIFKIDNLKIIKEDVILYNACLKEWDMPVPYPARIMERFIHFKYKRLPDILAIKMNSIQKKHFRYLVKLGQLDWELAKIASHNRNFRRAHLYTLSKFLHIEAERKGLTTTIVRW